MHNANNVYVHYLIVTVSFLGTVLGHALVNFRELGYTLVNFRETLNASNSLLIFIRIKRHAASAIVWDVHTPFLQFFTAEKLGRKCFAIEPMTCNVNAFNQADKEQLAVKPQHSRHMEFTIYGAED